MTSTISRIDRQVRRRHDAITVRETVTFENGEEVELRDRVDIEDRAVSQHTDWTRRDGHLFRSNCDAVLTHDLLAHPDCVSEDETWDVVNEYIHPDHCVRTGTAKRSRAGGFWRIDRGLVDDAWDRGAPLLAVTIQSTLDRRDAAKDYRSISVDRALRLVPEPEYETDTQFGEW